MAYKLVGGLKSGKFGHYPNKKAHDNTSDDQKNNEDVCMEKHVSEKDYCSVIKKVKKDNITPDNIGEIMLCQIPGVSSASALAILSQFKTLPNLIQCIKDDEQCLSNICTTDANGKSRKISKTAIATIVKFLKV